LRWLRSRIAPTSAARLHCRLASKSPPEIPHRCAFPATEHEHSCSELCLCRPNGVCDCSTGTHAFTSCRRDHDRGARRGAIPAEPPFGNRWLKSCRSASPECPARTGLPPPTPPSAGRPESPRRSCASRGLARRRCRS